MALYLGVVYPVVMTTRALRQDGVSENPYATFLDVALDARAQGEFSEEDPVSALMQRYFDPSSVAYIYGDVQRNGFMNGATMDYVTYAFVPRFLWPEKPGVTRGRWFTYYLGMADSEEEAVTSIGQTSTGELYWNFGMAGVCLGMTAIGATVGILWRVASARPYEHALKMLLYLSLFFAIVDQPEAGTVFVSQVFRFMVVGVPILLLTGRARNRRTLAT